jgi:hypothetical protein
MPITFSRDDVREPCYVVVPHFNPYRHKSRVKHTERALKHFHDSGAVIVLVEVGFNRREFVFENSGLDNMPAECDILNSLGGAGDPRFRHKYVPLRTESELWLKENAINIGVQRIPDQDWQQVAWLDSDIHFTRPNWVGQIIHQLQHYAFIQPFTHARDLGPNYEMLNEDYPHANGMGFVHAWIEGHLKTTLSPEIEDDLKSLEGDIDKLRADFLRLQIDLGCAYPGKRVFPGLAMACTRKAWEDVGGLLDVAIWGGGDWHMSHALIEKTEGMMRNDLHRNYKKIVNQWYQRCRTHIRRNVGVVEGSVLHHWHGKKTGRGYNVKHALLSEFGFDPMRHLKRDSQGLYQLHDDRSTSFVQIRDMMRRVAKERNEDSIDV